MSTEKKILILNQHQIEQKIDRIAYQLLEDNFDEEEIILAGILPKGNFIAERLKKILDKIAPFKSRLITIEVDKQSTSLKAKTDTDIAPGIVTPTIKSAAVSSANEMSTPLCGCTVSEAEREQHYHYLFHILSFLCSSIRLQKEY